MLGFAIVGCLLLHMGVQTEKSTVSEAVSQFSGVRTVFEVDEINGIEIFGSMTKTSICPDGKIIKSLSKVLQNFDSLPMIVLKNHPLILDKATIIKSVGLTEEQIENFYSKFVYFPSKDGLIPAIYCQVLTIDNGNEYVLNTADYSILYQNSLRKDYGPGTVFSFFDDDSPYPGTPGPSEPNGWQQLQVIPRTEIFDWPNHYSPKGWQEFDIYLSGNNCAAIINDAGDQSVVGDPDLDFRFPIDFDAPPFDSKEAISVNTFVLINQYHDEMCNHGFGEADRNFQLQNYYGQGVGNDRFYAYSMYNHGTNNAFFVGSGIDGTPASVTFLPFTNFFGTPDRHSSLGRQIIGHEATHGTTVRCIGELESMQSGAMDEGWSDLVSLIWSAKENDDPSLVYGIGGWEVWGMAECLTDNYYFGIRRYPITSNETKNPLTLGDMGTETYSVDPKIPQSCYGWFNFSVHSIGEIWNVALWECWDVLYHRYGYQEGRDRMLNITIEGMKLCPLSPTFLQARDAFLQADQYIYGDEDKVAFWKRFAKRGYGVNAWVSPSGNTEGPIEDFHVPDWGDYNQDGVKNIFDFLGFVNDYNSASYNADLNDDDTLDLYDFLEFVNLFNK